MGTSNRVQSILTKTVSVLVILLNLALITFVWIVQDDVSTSTVAVFEKVDNVAQVTRNGIARVEPEISNLRGLIGQVETASEDIAQNVSEEGIILRLLPETVVDRLKDSSQSLRENFIAVYDLLGATSDILLALDKMPFVEIPARGLSTIATLQENLGEIASQVETLVNNINDVRAETGARISRVTDAAAVLGAEADQFHADLIQIDTDLDSLQISVRKYQRLTPPVVISSVIIISLLSGWVVYSQVMMFSRSVKLNPLDNIKHVSEEQEPPLDEGIDG
jgi:hypothetical protein